MDKNGQSKSPARLAAYMAMFAAAAVLCSYIETLVPINITPIPGFKAGLANVVILLLLYKYGWGYALCVNIVRSIVIALLFSGLSGAIFSLCGGTLSIFAMAIVKRCEFFSIYSVGVAGAVMHNVGQLCAAAVLLRSLSVFAYFPWLMLCSVVCGAVIALAAALCIGAFDRLRV